MKTFDSNFLLLKEMYEDDYFPDFLVDKVRDELIRLIHFLENGNHTEQEVQDELDRMTNAINDLQDEFDENESEIETVARESIAHSVEYILDWFDVDIDIDTAICCRDW